MAHAAHLSGGMLGVATASLRTGPARWIERTWGCPEIHTRQKWSALWPFLEKLPETRLRLLDAGCGSGRWSLEIAARRPQWHVVGVDRNADEVTRAESARSSLMLGNASFLAADFLEFQPERRFDVILSVSSAHYLAGEGQGDTLFQRFHRWLAPGGVLLLLGPRRAAEVPAVSFLGRLPSGFGFSASDLRRLCIRNGFEVRLMSPEVGRLGTAAKQLAISAGKSTIGRMCAYPWQVLLTWLDGITPPARRQSSAIWVLFAEKAK
jgi:SAM-dependent methyltransferase